MPADNENAIKDVSPAEAWAALSDTSSVLVDCRTAQEWDGIGVPDLSTTDQTLLCVEWRKAPDMAVNSNFQVELEEAIGDTQPERIYFICRSGARSKEAAQYYQGTLSSSQRACECINVAEGFEGDPDGNGIRGQTNGWQARGLPWTKG